MSMLFAIYISVMAVCLSLSVVNLIIWLNQHKKIEYLLFALSALAAGGMAMMDGIGMRMNDPDKFLNLMKYYHIPIFVLLISIVWFIRIYFGTGRKWLAILITLSWSVCLIINFSSGHGLTYLSIESMQTHSFFGKDTFNLPVGVLNPLRLISDFTTPIILVYLIDATIALYKSGGKERALIIGGGTILFMMLAGIITPLADIGQVTLPSMISVPFMFILIGMSSELIKDVLKVQVLANSLKTRKRNWDNLVEKVELFVVKLDVMGKVELVNPYFLKRTGFTTSEVIKKDWLANFIPESDRKKLKQKFNLPIQGDFPVNNQNNILTKRGEELTIYWSNVGLIDENGSLSGLVAVGNDVTDRENSFKEVLNLKRQLEAENLALKESLGDTFSSSEQIVVKSAASKYAFEKARQVADVETNVLLMGETGVGKGIYAKFIHDNSSRFGKTFLHVNCAAIPHDLLESELFGHEKGAFTGAIKSKKGRFELADGGTLFLDEIAELPLALQPKLLRVLQSGEFESLGSEKTLKVDVRIITATNRILSDEVEKRNFREDLYYRLNVFPITIPPLRKRKEDITDLINLFVHQLQKKYRKNILKISKQTYLSFSAYDWPGNIRELQNVLERAVISCRGDVLKTNGLIEDDPNPDKPMKISSKHKLEKLEDVEKNHITAVLERCNWRIHGKNGAAEILDINPSTLRSRMKKLNISSKRFIEN